MPSPASRVRFLVFGTAIAAVTAGAGTAVAAEHTPPGNGSTTTGPHVPGHVLVRYSPDTDTAAQAALEHAVGASRLDRLAALDTDVLQVPAGAEERVIDALHRSGRVDYAELDGLARGSLTPNDAYWGQQWGPAKVNLPAAWDETTGSSSVVIAHLDTGVDAGHPDLSGRFTAGYDFVNGDNNPADDQGHGTSTAGILGARANNTTGVAGTCWTCTIMPVKVLDSTNWGSWSGISNGITYATDNGARIISMSIYGTTGSTTLQNAVTYAHNHGVLVVVAAGNDGTSTPSYPASYAGALSVAGTDSNDRLYSWSDYGSWVDVAAPGCDYTTKRGGGYGSFCGTSTATPIVAGIAGLLLTAAPSATVTQLEQALETSAVDMGSGVAYGRVDAAAALAALGSSPEPNPEPSPTSSPTASPAPAPSTTTVTFSGSTTNKTSSKSFTVSAGTGPLDATLSFPRASSMTLQLRDSTGRALATATGGSPVHLAADVVADTYTLVASSSQRSSFTLTVVTPTR